MCSDQRSFLKNLVAVFLCLPVVSALFLCVGTSALQAEEVRYPENLAWRLITEQELSLITHCPESFNEREHTAPPLFESPSIPMGGLEVAADSTGESFYKAELPSAWEVPPFAVIGPPTATKKSLGDASATSVDRHQTAISLQSSLSADQSLMPMAFGEIPTDYSRNELPAPNLRPLKAAYIDRLDLPDSQLPVPFSLRRYHTKTKGFFHIALYGNTEGLLAERMYNTLKAAAPNLRLLQGFGSKAFISFLPAPEPEKPFDLQTAKGEFTFSELEPEGAAQFDQLDPGLIKSQTAPSFKKIPVTPLPENFDEQLRRQLAAAPYKNIKIDDDSASDQPLYAGASYSSLNQSANKSDRYSSKTDNSNSSGDPLSLESDSSSQEAGSEDLNPFAVKTNFSKDLEGMYVMEIYYPQQSLVCELAADTRFADLRSMLDIALLVQARMQRW
ncbi:MAG: hypothetical protein ACI376_04725 [Candidatus Bruticola sp.]